jgi:hypothetical protein
MTSSTVSLNLGEIPSGSSGEKDFGKVATLYLPYSCKITFTLDRESASDFLTFEVTIEIYKEGKYVDELFIYKSYWFNEDSIELEAGTYDIYVSVKYEAVSVTTDTVGTVTITVSYPG